MRLKTTQKTECKTDLNLIDALRKKLPAVTETIIDYCDANECYTHIDYESLPSKDAVIDIIERMRELIFPGYFGQEKLEPVNLKYSMGRAVYQVFDLLAEQIAHSIRHECLRYDMQCQECTEKGYEIALAFLESVPSVRKQLSDDVRAAYDGDPAAKSYDEIIFSYPGLYAITVHRLAHIFYGLDVPLLPRMMSEHAHSITGIDIHPGAQIGRRFVIDHGTGVVIGETTRIGDNVRVYQGVTLGALSLPKDAGKKLKGKKRHPTIEDDVIIYSGATILGGETVIGKGSVIGGNVWMTESVPPHTRVLLESPHLIFK